MKLMLTILDEDEKEKRYNQYRTHLKGAKQLRRDNTAGKTEKKEKNRKKKVRK